MLQELIDAVNAYRQKHSESEAAGYPVEGLSDAYAHMLVVCDADQHGAHPTAAGMPASADNSESGGG